MQLPVMLSLVRYRLLTVVATPYEGKYKALLGCTVSSNLKLLKVHFGAHIPGFGFTGYKSVQHYIAVVDVKKPGFG